MKVKVGMKVKGFKFESRKHHDIAYHPDMQKYEGVVGVIGKISTNNCRIDFDGDYWFYPKEVIHRAFLSVGDKVKISKTKSAGNKRLKCSGAISRAIRKGQDYLYYTGEYDGKLILNDEFCEDTGEYFTLEDIELYEQEKENKMEIKKSELEKIYNVACSTWQGKIKEMANRNPFGDSVELTQDEIDVMFRAASTGQTKVLIEVFGEQSNEINLHHIEITDMVDGIPLFGGRDKNQNDVFISLPSNINNPQNAFWLNQNYNWELKGKMLIVTRK